MPTTKKEPPDIDAARSAKEKAKELLSDLDCVNGIGLTRQDGRYAVRVNVEEEPGEDAVPTEIDGVPVVLKVTGKIRKQ